MVEYDIRLWATRRRAARNVEDPPAPEVLGEWVRELVAAEPVRRELELERARVRAYNLEHPTYPKAEPWETAIDEAARALAGNPATPEEALVILAGDFSRSVRFAACSNPSFPRAELERLVIEGCVEARAAAAALVQEPLLGLIDWAADPDHLVRRGVAGNPNTPAEQLMALSMDPSMYVIKAAAGNPSMPLPRLEQLARFEDKGVRAAVAGNPASPSDVVTELARDPEWEVSRVAMRHPKLPDGVRDQIRAEVEEAWARKQAEGVARPVNRPRPPLE